MPIVNTSMQGNICMVTGANSGIGKATALKLAQMGATVVMVCQERARGEEAKSEIITKSRNTAVDLLQADLSSQQSIRQLVENFHHHYTRLHVLLNNAGAAFPERRETVDGLEMTLAVNYLAPFLLTHLLLDVLKASVPARIINVSSNSHEAGYIKLDNLQSKNPYGSMKVYRQAKLAVVLFTYKLARRLQGTGVTANCLHPGFVATHFGQRDVGPAFRLLVKVIGSFGASPEKGAKGNDSRNRKGISMENSEQFGQAVVDALTATIVVIEQDGTIRAVNEAWKRFAQENSGHRDMTSTSVGGNYLEPVWESSEGHNLIHYEDEYHLSKRPFG